MKKLLIAAVLGLLPAASAWAIQRSANTNAAQSVVDSTVSIVQNGATPNIYPNAPLTMTGNINSYLQSVIQNLNSGNNASSEYTGSNDLGSNTSFYFTVGIQSSKYSQANFALEPASATFFQSGDTPIFIWSDVNSGLNGATSGYVLIGAGNEVASNIGEMITPSSTTVFNRLQSSSATLVGVEVSTAAAGSAGTAVTVLCNQSGTTPGLFAIGGGCNCSGAVAETANISVPNVIVPGGIATGWTCQVTGGTGGACSAYVICSRLQ